MHIKQSDGGSLPPMPPPCPPQAAKSSSQAQVPAAAVRLASSLRALLASPSPCAALPGETAIAALLTQGARGVFAEARHATAHTALARAVSNLAPRLRFGPGPPGRGLAQGSVAMVERLLRRTPPPPAGAAVGARHAAHLTRADCDVLRILYAAAQSQGVHLEAVDAVAHALGGLRALERALRPGQPGMDGGVSGRELGSAPRPAAERANAAPNEPPVPREADPLFGMAQLVARSTSAYGSLVSPAITPQDASTHASLAGSSLTPLDLARALGLSGLLLELGGRARARARLRRRRAPAGEKAGPVAMQEDLLFDEAASSPARNQRRRWLRLLRARRRPRAR